MRLTKKHIGKEVVFQCFNNWKPAIAKIETVYRDGIGIRYHDVESFEGTHQHSNEGWATIVKRDRVMLLV